MRLIKFILVILILSSIPFALALYYLKSGEIPKEQLYEVEIPARREIKQTISATGLLKLKDQIKINTLVNGRIKKIFAKENQYVEEGDLLVEIDTAVGDTDVRKAEAAYEKALAELEYEEANYQRQKQLFEEQFLSDAALQESKKCYFTTLADTKALKASYDKEVLILKNHKVFAPTSGIVIQIHVSRGEKVTQDEGGALLLLAPHVTQIEAELEIEEKDIGQIQKGQTVHLTVDTFPNKIFDSIIQNVSFASNGEKEKKTTYQAIAYIDNPHLLLRPGMSINAIIDVSSVDSALSLTSRPFIVKKEHLKFVAELLNFPIKSIEKGKKNQLLTEYSDRQLQFAWKACNHCFEEVPIEIGITDDLYFEVKSDLNGTEKLVAEVFEEDKMKKFYEKLSRKL